MSNRAASRRWSLQPNPIVVKELRSRMRGGRAFILLTGFLLGLGLVGYGLFLRATSGQNNGAPIFSAQVGQTLFAGLAFMLLFLVILIAPAVTVGAISSERERLTYEMLIATNLPSHRLLWGKLISALSYIALLLLAAIPLGSIVFLFGGITLRHVIQAAVIIGLSAITSAMLGIWASAMTGKTGRAAVVSYVIIGLVLGGFLSGAEIWTKRTTEPVPTGLLAPNPISALASSLGTLSGPSSGGGITTMRAFEAVPMAAGGGPGWWPGSNPFSNTGLNFPGWQTFSIGIYPATDQFGPDGMPIIAEPRSVWRITIIILIMACLAFFWMALHAVKPRRRWWPTWGDAAMLSVTSLSLLGLGFWIGWWFR
ncbi:ABC transporter permease [Herpetosiphon llansteffanensis]|uniref:ABC transporter permease n=1 Tax=Herpetosiphon llansteffanensis TaxID=2094568 RepID=UPI000D7C29DE|nr:ABC transporter permease [Herpetosiphon llansteffanensis]